MISTFVLIPTKGLTESTSLQLVAAIQTAEIAVPFWPKANSGCAAIATTYAQQGDMQQGQGPSPILLLHGFDSSVMEFRRLIPLLAQHTQTWAVDLLGFGFTERPDGLAISPDTIQQHLYAFWQTQIQRPVILVGASMGGAAAIQFALAYPEAVQKLVLIDSVGYNNGPALGKFLTQPLGYWATEKFLRQPKVRQKICKKAYHDSTFASLDAQRCTALHLDCPNWSNALISFTRNGGYPSMRSQLSCLHLPTLILWGESDRILGTRDAARLHQAIQSSQLIWIPNCGHVPHLEKPDFTAEKILKFIQSSVMV